MQRTDKEDKFFFLLAAFLSLLIFGLFLFGFIYLLFVQNNIQKYGFEKKKYFSVSIDIKQNIKKTIPKKATKKKTITKKKKIKKKQVVDPTISEDIAVDDLFDTVWTKKVTPSKKIKRDHKKLAQIEETFSYEKIEKKEPLQQNSQKTKEESKSSSAEVVNKYLATIHAIVYEHFFPPQNTQGLEVKVVIELSSLGKMLDFRVLNYSTNSLLNQEVDQIKQRLKTVLFPKNPNNTKARVIIILKPQDKE
ncbi:MAG: TonB C-terminal domain-containing protein [Epsilonproteobacteria bacterium]|nr:TonB C-terminal domain-containing protein [Campylobacterota bacterium]